MSLIIAKNHPEEKKRRKTMKRGKKKLKKRSAGVREELEAG